VGGDAAPPKRLNEVRPVLERRAEEDRHLVKAGSLRGGAMNLPYDLDALAPLTGAREDGDRLVGRSDVGGSIREEIGLQPIERRRSEGHGRGRLSREAKSFQRVERRCVPIRDCAEHERRSSDESS